MSEDFVVHLDGLTVAPDQWLVLCSREALHSEQLQRIRDCIPEALRGRVLVVDQMAGFVMDAPGGAA